MTRHPSPAALAIALVATVLGRSGAHAAGMGGVEISRAWSRPVAAQAVAAVGYLTIRNRGVRPDRLLGGSTPAAARLEIHQSTLSGGIMRMREVTGGVALPPGGTVSLEPGGYHLMFVRPIRAFRAGDPIPATLDFARAGKVHVEFAVQAEPPAPSGSRMPMPMR